MIERLRRIRDPVRPRPIDVGFARDPAGVCSSRSVRHGARLSPKREVAVLRSGGKVHRHQLHCFSLEPGLYERGRIHFVL